MNWKSFIIGIATGIALSVVAFFVIAYIGRNSSNDQVKHLEQPASYENKTTTSFKVFQVFEDAALAREESKRVEDIAFYYGNTVLIVGDNFYNNQIITIKKPMRVGTFSYVNNAGIPMTVPIIDGDME